MYCTLCNQPFLFYGPCRFCYPPLKDKTVHNEFEQGYACAISCIVKTHGASTETREALEAAGLTTEQKMLDVGIDEYDIEILQPLLKEIALRK